MQILRSDKFHHIYLNINVSILNLIIQDKMFLNSVKDDESSI